LNDVVARPTTW